MTETSNTKTRKSKRSIRTQMIIGTIVSLTIVLASFGAFVRYTVATTLLRSVDRDLTDRLSIFQHRPPPPGQGGAPPFGGDWRQFQGGPPGNGHPFNGFPFDGGPQIQGGPGPNQGPFQNQPPQQFTPGQQPGGGQQDPNNQGPPRVADGNHQGFGFGSQNYRSLHMQNDPFRVRRFDANGVTVDGPDRLTAWDVGAINKSAITGKVVLSTVRSDGADLRLATQEQKSPDGQATFLQAPYPLAATEAAIAGVDRALLILIPIALLIAAIGGAIVTRGVLKRVGQMVQTVGKIGAKDLSRRLSVAGGDEFAELAETFNALLSRVEEAFREQERIVEQQRRFTADASHELKTPLTVIRGTTSLALSGNGTLDRQSTLDIDSAAASMSELVHDLIFLARSDTGKLGRERIEILLIEPLQRAIDQIASISEPPINFVGANENLIVNANEGEMVRLFSNLINNAAHHTPSDGRIIVSLSSTSEEAIVMVNDSGVGIAPQHIEHLGERFYRVDSSRTRVLDIGGGSGLGLAICLGIVEAHHGTMAIDSVLGKGTTVTISLPRVNGGTNLAE